MDLSNQTLRITLFNGEADKKREVLYQKVLDSQVKQKIELRSENWKLWTSNARNKYWILEQRDSRNKPIGAIKIILKERSEEEGIFKKKIICKNTNDWIYYVIKRRAEV